MAIALEHPRLVMMDLNKSMVVLIARPQNQDRKDYKNQQRQLGRNGPVKGHIASD